MCKIKSVGLLWVGMIRPATHAGSWYTANKSELTREIANWLSKVPDSSGSRFAIGPHAGFRFCGEVLAHTYKSLPSQIKRVIIMGPSHFKYFKGIKTTQFTSLETPLGPIEVDAELTQFLINNSNIGVLDEASDLKEHSWEMHLPFLKTVLPNAKVIPLLFGANSTNLAGVAEPGLSRLRQLIMNEDCALVVSSDFCHWGRGFDYTPYANQAPLIYKHIEQLDLQALEVLQRGDPSEWRTYINATKNTICGEKPIGFMLELAQSCGMQLRMKTLKYSQSSRVRSAQEMSVSYAAAVSI